MVPKYAKNPHWLVPLTRLPIPASWEDFFSGAEFHEALRRVQESLTEDLEKEDLQIFPEQKDIFRAFDLCHYIELKVVILGQDCYPQRDRKTGRPQAQGLSFSVAADMVIPKSLSNIFSALEKDPEVSFVHPGHGCLESWARQGVLLLNCALTVRDGQKESHLPVWREFTDAILRKISKDFDHVVFILWGRIAQEKSALLDRKKHAILTYHHPSPLAGDFSGCRNFSEANRILGDWGKTQIDWQL
ncbi:MAG: uracil-DNA glycosylase [Sulfobacillus sp.]